MVDIEIADGSAFSGMNAYHGTLDELMQILQESGH